MLSNPCKIVVHLQVQKYTCKLPATPLNLLLAERADFNTCENGASLKIQNGLSVVLKVLKERFLFSTVCGLTKLENNRFCDSTHEWNLTPMTFIW